MERIEFLELCQKVAIIKNSSCSDKQQELEKLKVVANECKYYPVAYELKFDKNGNAIHTAVLHDLNARSVTYCPLEGVKKLE